jgi:hypothetical protein
MPILDRARFRIIAADGLERSANATAHSMAYFNGALYVGTSCGNVSGADDTPRILRYDAEHDSWTVAYQSPLVEPDARSFVPDLNLIKTGNRLERFSGRRRGRSAQPVPRDVGFRSMHVFQGAADAKPALYATTLSRPGGTLLRSEDGATFTQVGEVGLGDRNVYSFRGLTNFGKWLFTAPAGTVTDEWLDRNLAPEPKVLATQDPASGDWVEASEPGFGDPGNVAIYALCVAHGYLYAGTMNPERGYQLWRTTARGKPPFPWEPIILDGAGAYNHNLAITAMTEFDNRLYVGSGITGFGYDTIRDIGPASAELVRVHSDGSWDLIAGRMRFTKDGLRIPLSLLGPGLGDFYNSVVWALAVHDGTIYLGTHQWEAFQCLQVDAEKAVGGYQLWASEDGENWRVVIEDGDGNPAEIGIRTLASTPFGLVVGTHNQSRLLKLLGRRKRAKVNDLADGFRVLVGNASALIQT